MRALVVISGLATGGAERVTVSFLRRLPREGVPAVACTVTSRHDGPLAAELADAGVERRDLGARRLADPRAFGRLIALLRRERFDLVHAHGQDASILCAAARAAHATPLVITRHVLDEPAATHRQRLRARAALAACRRADARIAVSDAAAERLAELTELPRAAIRVIRNGIDLDRFGRESREDARAALRSTLPVESGDALVLVPAVLREGKDHDRLLDALPAIRARVPRVRLLFAGDGDRERELRRRARPFGDTVLFLGRRDDVPTLLAACDLVALPSGAEALPTALIEAAAAARPVVATRVGGTAEIVEHGRTGLLVPPDDTTALADAIVSLLLGPAGARAFGRDAAALARARFGLDRQLRCTLELWETLSSESRP